MRNIPFSPVDISDNDIENVVKVLKSSWITTGPVTKLFEKETAKYCGTNKAVALSSATAAMEMTLRLLGVGPGDEVITGVYTYTASASVVCHVGAKLVLVDSGKDSPEIDYDKIADAITENTKVIIPVDVAGIMCDYDRIFEAVEVKRHLFKPSNDIQRKFGRVIVMADAAHSFGAEYHGKRSGNVADFTAFSYHAVKNITSAEGGAVTWRDIAGIDNESIYKQYQLLSLHGQSKDALERSSKGKWEYDIVYPAYKCNMTDIQAALVYGQLMRYDSILKRRQAIVEYYNRCLYGKPVKVLDHYSDTRSSSGHLYLVRIDAIDEEKRNKIIMKMFERGIAVNVHYKPLPMHTAYKNLGFCIEDFPNAFSFYQNEITLPLNTRITDEETEYVMNEFINILRV